MRSALALLVLMLAFTMLDLAGFVSSRSPIVFVAISVVGLALLVVAWRTWR
jgi:hypothetical protein